MLVADRHRRTEASQPAALRRRDEPRQVDVGHPQLASDRAGGVDAITISVLPVTEHARTLIRTCWTLGGREEYKALNLRRWAHQLGYRGHIASKSRAYSTTYTALRAAREQHRRDHNDQEETPDDIDTITDKDWTYTGNGHTVGQAMFADAIADDLQAAREAAYDARMGGEQDGP